QGCITNWFRARGVPWKPQAITTTTSGYPAEPLTVALIPSRSWPLRNVLADVLILTVCQFVDVAVEDHFPVAQHEKTHGDVAVLAFGQYPHLICLLIELMSCHGESVLQAMGHQQRAGLMDIPLFHDQFDDGIGSDGI